MDFNKIVKGLSSSGAVSGFAGGLAGSALVGAVSGKKGKKMAKNALKVGALAAVGGLAYKAYTNYRQQNGQNAMASGNHSAGALPAGEQWNNIGQERFEAVVEDEQSPGALLLIRAMIAAAASDGHMDNHEQDRVFEQADRLNLSQQDKAALFDELRNPLGMQALVSQVKNPETAVEVYAASLAAIDESRSEAKTYLRALAVSLELPAELVQSIHAEVAAAKEQEAAA